MPASGRRIRFLVDAGRKPSLAHCIVLSAIAIARVPQGAPEEMSVSHPVRTLGSLMNGILVRLSLSPGGVPKAFPTLFHVKGDKGDILTSPILSGIGATDTRLGPSKYQKETGATGRAKERVSKSVSMDRGVSVCPRNLFIVIVEEFPAAVVHAKQEKSVWGIGMNLEEVTNVGT